MPLDQVHMLGHAEADSGITHKPAPSLIYRRSLLGQGIP
jgi:hypothetical protein